MEIKSIVKEIIFIPSVFNSRDDVSPYTLLKNSGYFKAYNEIDENTIQEELKLHPNCVKDWLQYSADQRTTSGWIFSKEERKYWIFGKKETKYSVYYFKGKEISQKMDFQNEFEACAAYIKREIEQIRAY